MTPVAWWSYPAWALTEVLEGALLATYGVQEALAGRARDRPPPGVCCRSLP